MGLFGWKSLTVWMLIAVYMVYPAPPLSKHLQTWKESGKWFTYENNAIFYRDDQGSRAEGPVLVCLHGYPSSSYDWIKVWPALLGKFSRVIAPDLLGFGFSDKPGDHKYSIMEQADIVEKLLQRLHIRNFHLLAHDYGDTVAQELLARYEDRKKAGQKDPLQVKSLCLTNGGVFPETNFPQMVQKALLIPYVGAFLGRLSGFLVFKRSFGEVFGAETQPTADEFSDFWASVRYNDGNLVLHSLLQYIPERRANRERWVGVLHSTSVPVQMVYGPADPVNPPAFVEHYKKLVPEGRIAVLEPHIGHYPLWEDPSGSMKAYLAFLKTLPFDKHPKT